jgi:leucine dehydrogenase
MQHLRPNGHQPEQVFHLVDEASGLEAWLVLDSTALGPAVGGIRTRSYASADEAEGEARALAWAMSIKCSLAGLDAGGAKTVVRVRPGMDRVRAFAFLGTAIQGLEGRYVAGADLGTGAADLAVLQEHTDHVHVNESDLTDALAHGHLACVEAVSRVYGGALASSAAIQGMGSVGRAVAERLSRRGMTLTVADVDPTALGPFQGKPGVDVVDPGSLLHANVDLLVPCALGGVLTSETVQGIQASALVPGANNVFADEAAERELVGRGVVSVPDVISSAGAVVHGIGRSLMGWVDCRPRVRALGEVAEEVLQEARASRALPGVVARQRALDRMHGGRV